VANLGNLVIDYREPGDTVRIVIFALAVELNEPVKKDAVENQTELRNDICALSKRRQHFLVELPTDLMPLGRGLM
jgi:hypothetical protein